VADQECDDFGEDAATLKRCIPTTFRQTTTLTATIS
jgi:hypothetical protein